ncbi:MAG TPA: ABC transporter substrate-binding protein [Mycobacteriales bacterium]|nr:ABC transporter substrate-binding protein [Mycobacteriales bacterium]
MLRSRWIVAGTVLALGALSACGDDNSGSTKKGESYTIGVWGPAQIPQGKDILDGAALAVAEINKNTDLTGGRTLKIVTCDSVNGASPDKAVACANKLISQDKVDALLGGFSSGETVAMLDTVVDGQVPYLSAGAASPDVVKGVTSGGPRKYIFRIGPISSTSLAADMCLTYVAKLAPATGFTKYGILYEDVEFARPLVAFLKQCLPNPSAATGGKIPITKGVSVVATEKHLPDATDFSSQFRALKSAGAQFVIEVNSRQEGVALAKQWGTLKPGFALGGINVAGQANGFFAATGGAAVGELNGPAGVVRAAITPKTIPFFDAFKAKYGRDPIYNGTSAYDGVYALAEALKVAGSSDPDDVVTALEKMDRVGAQGVEKFTAEHDITYGGIDPTKGIVPVYYQFAADGSKKIVFPQSFSGGYAYAKPAGVK